MRWLELKVPPLVQVLLVAGGMWVLSHELPAPAAPDAIRHGLAAIVGLAGIASSLAGKLQFVSAGPTVKPLAPEPAPALVPRGIYPHTPTRKSVGSGKHV